jgi:hypothetical protein
MHKDMSRKFFFLTIDTVPLMANIKVALAVSAAALVITGAAATSPASRSAAIGGFFARSADGRLAACDMYIPGSGKRGVICASAEGTEPNVFQEAKVLEGGQVKICTSSPGCPWVFDDPDPGPTFGVGKRITVRPFRCRVLEVGVQCTLIATGKGFLINSHEAVRVN